MENLIFNYLRESLILKKDDKEIILSLRNPDGKWVEISRISTENENLDLDDSFFISKRNYISNDD